MSFFSLSYLPLPRLPFLLLSLMSSYFTEHCQSSRTFCSSRQIRVLRVKRNTIWSWKNVLLLPLFLLLLLLSHILLSFCVCFFFSIFFVCMCWLFFVIFSPYVSVFLIIIIRCFNLYCFHPILHFYLLFIFLFLFRFMFCLYQSIFSFVSCKFLFSSCLSLRIVLSFHLVIHRISILFFLFHLPCFYCASSLFLAFSFHSPQ